MFGKCRKCSRDVDGLREELNPEFICRTCEESPRLTPLQLEFLTKPAASFGTGKDAWSYERTYTRFEIAILAEIPEEQRDYFYTVTIPEATRAGILHKHGTKVYRPDGTETSKAQFAAFTHSSVSRLLVRLRPDLAAGLVAAVFADSTIDYVAIGREWFESFAAQLQRIPPPIPQDDSGTYVKPADASAFDEVCRMECPGVSTIGPLERTHTLSRLMRYRRIIADLRSGIRQSGLYLDGPQESKPTPSRVEWGPEGTLIDGQPLKPRAIA